LIWILDAQYACGLMKMLLISCLNATKKVWRELQLEQNMIDLASVFLSKEVFFYIWKLDGEVQIKLITTL
jgi:hypothetical protein